MGDNANNYISVDECIPVNYGPGVSYVLPTRFACNYDSQHIRLDHEMCVKKIKPSLDTDQPDMYLASGEEQVCGTQDGVDVLQLRNSTGDYLVNTLIGDKITTSGNNIDYEPVKVCVYNNFPPRNCDTTDASSPSSECEELRSLDPSVGDYFSR